MPYKYSLNLTGTLANRQAFAEELKKVGYLPAPGYCNSDTCTYLIVNNSRCILIGCQDENNLVSINDIEAVLAAYKKVNQ